MRKIIAGLCLWALPLFGDTAGVVQEIPDQNPLKIMTQTLKERKTMKLRLGNGMDVYLISDPEANKSAAAIAVEVGSWQDPEQYPGMAHFCEHMLFMGSKKYPDEEGFFLKVSDSGGSANAYTWTDRTVYGFSCNHKQFPANLDIFAHFFIDPLFDKNSVNRELLAVNQEYAKNIENDGWREWQIFKETGNQKHPNSRFSTGNEDTLKIIPIETLANWYRLHYSADKMHLVIYSNEDLSCMKTLVIKSFSAVPDANPPAIPYDQVMSEQQRGSIIYIEPVCDVRTISFSWEMPPQVAKDGDAQIPDLIAYTLSYKGENSLFESLYRQGLAESLSADVLKMRQDQSMIILTIELTKKGVAEQTQIIEETFASIKELEKEGIPHFVFQEMQKSAEIDYKWQQRSDEFSFAMSTASEMINEPIETYPYKSRIIQTIKPAAIKSTLAEMSPKNTMITVKAPSCLTKVPTDQKEKWCGGEYKIVKIEPERLEYLTALTPSSTVGMPKPNPYIPDHLSMKNKEQKPEAFTPTLLVDDTFGKCYFMEDEFYLAPEIVVKLGLKSPAIRPTLQSYIMTDMTILLLERKLITMTSQAARGGIYTSIGQNDLRLELNIRGPAETCPLVMTNMANGLKTLCPTKQEFEQAKETLISNYANRQKSLAFQQAKDMMNSILNNDEFYGGDLSRAVTSIGFEDYLLFNEELIQSLYVEGVMCGNLSEKEAYSHWINLKTTLNPAIYPVSEQYQAKVLLLSKDHGPYEIPVTSSMQGNATLLMIQIPTISIGKTASRQVLSQILWSSFFDTLRTKQQTGYIAKAWSTEKDEKIMLFFTVQSTTHSPQELLARFELYLEDFVRNFDKELPRERFAALKETTIINLTKPPTNLAEKTGQLYYFAFERNGDFERRQRTIEAIKGLEYETFKEDVASFVSRSNPNRLAILVEGKDGQDKSLTYHLISYEQAKSL